MKFQSIISQIMEYKECYEESSLENQEFEANPRYIELCFRYYPFDETLPFLEIINKCSVLKKCNIMIKPFYCKNNSSLIIIKIPTRNQKKIMPKDVIERIHNTYDFYCKALAVN